MGQVDAADWKLLDQFVGFEWCAVCSSGTPTGPVYGFWVVCSACVPVGHPLDQSVGSGWCAVHVFQWDTQVDLVMHAFVWELAPRGSQTVRQQLTWHHHRKTRVFFIGSNTSH